MISDRKIGKETGYYKKSKGASDNCHISGRGNLAFFYNDFRESPQLVPLGTITAGEEYLEQLDTLGEIIIDAYEE